MAEVWGQSPQGLPPGKELDMDIKEEALRKHREWQGKIEITSRAPITSREELALAYTPGVAQPCLEIQKDPI